MSDKPWTEAGLTPFERGDRILFGPAYIADRIHNRFSIEEAIEAAVRFERERLYAMPSPPIVKSTTNKNMRPLLRFAPRPYAKWEVTNERTDLDRWD